jgi:hypothetical protein
MAESMIERVARAICTAAGIDPDRKGNETEWRWQEFEKEARAVIKEMREPTDVMVDAGDAVEPGVTGYTDALSHYQTMIDAALNEQVSR